MMSREDVLRELELLPVWQLRNPIAGSGLASKLTQSEQVISQETISDQLVSIAETAMPSVSFRLIASDDGQWLFALKLHQTEAAETLLQNMLVAVSVKIGQETTAAPITTPGDFQPKVIVAMGEIVAQSLLALSQPLAQLRGNVHRLKETPVIVTYAPDDLLQNTADKASAWADLCLAKFTIADL